MQVAVTATNAAGSTQALSATTPPVGAPSPAVTPTVTPPPTPVAHAPIQRALRLTHVAVRGGRGRRALVFTLSARARVEITVSGSGRARSAAADAVRLSVSGHRGANRLVLSRLLHGRRLRHGRYALTVRAGNRAVTVALNVA